MPWPLSASSRTDTGHVDVQLRAASTAMPTTPTVLILPTVALKTGSAIDYDPVTGVFTFKRTGIYFHNFLLNVTATANRTIYAGAQIDTGSGFSYSRYSGRSASVTSNTDGQTILISNNKFEGDTYTNEIKLRFVLWASGACNLVTADIPGVTPGTLTTPAIRIMYSEISG